MKDYVTNHSLTFLNLLDPKSDLAGQYRVHGVPISFFINTRSEVVAVAPGYREWKSADGLIAIEQLLSETD